jgi:hypothetical protein
VTGTRVFTDGAALVLAVPHTSDWNGRVFSGPLEPDEAVEPRARGPVLTDQPVMRAALEWLAAQRACQE